MAKKLSSEKPFKILWRINPAHKPVEYRWELWGEWSNKLVRNAFFLTCLDTPIIQYKKHDGQFVKHNEISHNDGC